MKPALLPTRTLLAAALLSSSVAHAETLLRFNFDEGSGNTVSTTNANLTGILARTPSYPTSSTESPSGAPGDRSLRIVDQDGYIALNATNAPALAATDTPITAEAWAFIPVDSEPRNESIVAYGGSWKFGLRSNGTVAFTLYGVIDAEVGAIPPLGTWTHLAAVWQPGVGVTFYIDGSEMGFFEETRPMRAPSNDYLVVGGSSAFTEPVNATLDRVRVHRAALTADQLDSVAASPKPTLATTVVAFSLNESTEPFVNAGSIGGSATHAFNIVRGLLGPRFTADTPSRQSGDTALEFDGNDLVRVDDPNQVLTLVPSEGTTSDFTVQAWVKPGVQPGGQSRSVLLGYFGTGGAFSFSISNDRKVAITTYGFVDMISDAVIPNDGQWHHLAVVHRNGQDMRFYVDGLLGDTRPYTQGLNVRGESHFWIGSEFGGGLPYVGLIDRLQVANTALEPDDLDYLAIPGVNPDAPTVEVGTAVQLSWPATATGFQLQSTTDLNEPRTWTTLNVPLQAIGDKVYALLPTPEQKTFYRLFRP